MTSSLAPVRGGSSTIVSTAVSRSFRVNPFVRSRRYNRTPDNSLCSQVFRKPSRPSPSFSTASIRSTSPAIGTVKLPEPAKSSITLDASVVRSMSPSTPITA